MSSPESSSQQAAAAAQEPKIQRSPEYGAIHPTPSFQIFHGTHHKLTFILLEATEACELVIDKV
jgi:hypothetical protein